MKFTLKKLTQKEALKFCNILTEYSCNAIIRSKDFFLDAKSILGVLLLTNKAENPILEIDELDGSLNKELISRLAPFIKGNNDDDRDFCSVCSDRANIKVYEELFGNEMDNFRLKNCPLCGKKLK